MHVVFDAQISLRENSISRYLRGLIGALCTLSNAPHITLLLQSPRSELEIRSANPWLPGAVDLDLVPGDESHYSETRLQRLQRTLVRWPRACARLGADVLHCQMNDLPRRLKSCAIVTSLHDVFQWVPQLGRKRLPLHRALERYRYRVPTCILAASENTRQDFLRYVDATSTSVRVVHYGVEGCFSPISAEEDRRVYERHGLEPQRYLLYVGDLQPRKDVSTLLRAYAAASSSQYSLPPLAIVGYAWGGRSLERDLARDLGIEKSVLFPGRVEEADLPAVYRGARLFVFPSLYEGFGFPVLEAMASGVPVVTTRSSSLPEVAGGAATLFDPGDADALAAILRTLPGDQLELERRRAAGLERAAQFGWERTAAATLEAYQAATALMAPTTVDGRA